MKITNLKDLITEERLSTAVKQLKEVAEDNRTFFQDESTFFQSVVSYCFNNSPKYTPDTIQNKVLNIKEHLYSIISSQKTEYIDLCLDAIEKVNQFLGKKDIDGVAGIDFAEIVGDVSKLIKPLEEKNASQDQRALLKELRTVAKTFEGVLSEKIEKVWKEQLSLKQLALDLSNIKLIDDSSSGSSSLDPIEMPEAQRNAVELVWGRGRTPTITIFSKKGEQKEIDIFYENPNETLRKKSKLSNLAKEFEDEYVQIQIKGYKAPLFVKVDDLSLSFKNASRSQIIKARKEGELDQLIESLTSEIDISELLHISKVEKLIEAFGIDELKKMKDVKNFIELTKTVSIDFFPALKNLYSKRVIAEAQLVDTLKRMQYDRTLKNTSEYISYLQGKKELKPKTSIPSKKAEGGEKETFGFIVDEAGKIHIKCHLLGRGTFKKAMETDTGFVCVSLKGEGAQGEIENEKKNLEILSKLNHPNIMEQYFLTIETKTKKGAPKFIMLQKKMDSTLSDKLAPHHVLNALRGIADALAAMNEADIIHGDVKPDNMLFKGDKNSTDAIQGYAHDFGAMTRPGKFLGGTVAFLSPELALLSEQLAAARTKLSALEKILVGKNKEYKVLDNLVSIATPGNSAYVVKQYNRPPDVKRHSKKYEQITPTLLAEKKKEMEKVREEIKKYEKSVDEAFENVRKMDKALDAAMTVKSADPFALGVSIFYLGTSVPYFADNKRELWTGTDKKIETEIQNQVDAINISQSLTEDEKGMKTGMLAIAKQLLQFNQEKRISCREAAKQLDSLCKKYQIKEQTL